MLRFCFLLKTYRRDLVYASRLVTSYNAHNKESIPLFIILPREDFEYYNSIIKETDTSNITVFFEDDFKDYLSEATIHDLSAGYINQEIIKLSFHEKNLCENYMCLDSDCFFIRDFFYSDFMFNETEPYSILYEDKELQSDPFYYKAYWHWKNHYIKKIMSEMNLSEKRWLNCHGFQIFSTKVLRSFKKDFMMVKGYDYKKLMEIAPLEFSWYNYFLQKTNIIPMHYCGEIFKTFHLNYHHVWSLVTKTTLTDYARAYVGIIINSNTSKKIFRDYADMSGYTFSLSKRHLIHAFLITIKTDFIAMLRTMYHKIRRQK